MRKSLVLKSDDRSMAEMTALRSIHLASSSSLHFVKLEMPSEKLTQTTWQLNTKSKQEKQRFK